MARQRVAKLLERLAVLHRSLGGDVADTEEDWQAGCRTGIDGGDAILDSSDVFSQNQIDAHLLENAHLVEELAPQIADDWWRDSASDVGVRVNGVAGRRGDLGGGAGVAFPFVAEAGHCQAGGAGPEV